jgi:geranylgeranyl pyrophosphate synthase
MWQEKQSGLLRAEIEALLGPLSETDGLIKAIRDSLEKAHLGNLRSGLPWALLPMIVCDSVGGHVERAIPVAASIMLFKTAADVFDDVEDKDAPESIAAKSGEAVATNAATALLILAETELGHLKERGVSAADIVSIAGKVNAYHLTACAGQHSDIISSGDLSVSESQYLKMIEKKTAAQLECSFHCGAVLGTADVSQIDLLSTAGKLLGMAAQLANDIYGITSGNDVKMRKISLPAIFALENTRGTPHQRLAEKLSLNCVGGGDEVREILFQSGAMQYAAIKLETYRQEGLKKLFEARESGVRIDRLSPFYN